MTEQQNKIYGYILICDYKARFVVSVQRRKKRKTREWPFFQTPGVFHVLKQGIFAFNYVFLFI